MKSTCEKRLPRQAFLFHVKLLEKVNVTNEQLAVFLAQVTARVRTMAHAIYDARARNPGILELEDMTISVSEFLRSLEESRDQLLGRK